MIHLQTPPLWRQILRTNFTQWEKLADFLELTAAQRSLLHLNKNFPLNLPMRLAQKIPKQDIHDPIAKQFLPLADEKDKTGTYTPDPTGEMACRRSPKLLQKYKGRALLVCTSACAMHCRYCFRQNFEYAVKEPLFEEELKIIGSDPSLQEVILSGGDPLSLADEILQILMDRLCEIPHVKRLRIHTRFPIGIPERIDERFLQLLRNIPKQIWFVIHTNHPRELDDDVVESLNKLRKLGIVVLNQTVLLRGVNDNCNTLKELCEILVNNGIVPYYLHQLDRVEGASRFEVPEEEGKQLIEELRKQLSGYAVPNYVKEIYGEPSKTAIQ